MRFREYLREGTLNLGGGASKAALEAFMEEFVKATFPNPFFSRMRIWNESVGIELYSWHGQIHISSIMSFKEKNAGEASKALKWITDLADKHQVKLDLAVQPIKNAGAADGKNLNKTQLKSWYKRNGFAQTGGDHMLRLPKTKDESPE